MKGIEYATASWSPVTGCTCGCGYCWARRMATRMRGRFGYWADDPFRPTFHKDKLDKPRTWRKPRIVATCFMGDLFDPYVPRIWQREVMRVMRCCPQHTFLLLTKQTIILAAFAETLPKPWPENVWAGVSVTGDADRQRIDALCDANVSHRWVSYEPALGPLQIGDLPTFEWLVAGCQTGPGARPAHPDWFRRVRNDCQAAGMPFWFKSWGAFRPLMENTGLLIVTSSARTRGRDMVLGIDGNRANAGNPPYALMSKLRAEGEPDGLLDGREHRELPKEWI